MVRKLFAWPLLGVGMTCFPQAVSEDVRLLARIRDHVGSQITSLEDYTCLQIARRYRLQGKDASKRHRIESSEVMTLEVAHIGEKELFAWPGAGRFDDRQASEIVAGGLTDTGSYSSFARSLFQPRTPAILRYYGSEQCHAKDAVRYDFSISVLFSGYTIKSPSGSAQTGYSGSFWAYPDTLDLCRLVIRADDIPEWLRLSEVRTVIDYGRVQIGNSLLTLPQTARTTLTSTSGDVTENLTDFTHCRRYSADSSLLFGDPPEQQSSTPRQIETVVLPGGLLIPLKLLTAIDSRTARVGDAISAVVETAVGTKRRTWLPIGTVVNGRIRRLEEFVSPSGSVLLGLEFTDFSNDDHRGLFFADFQPSDNSKQVQTILKAPSINTSWTTLLHGGGIENVSIEEFTNVELPGVATFNFSGRSCVLPAGTRMLWRTKELGARQ